MTGNEIVLGLVALVLVVFSLVVSLLIPRRDPGFPGRNIKLFTVVAVALVIGMLTSVELLGAEHEEGEGAEAAETGETATDEGGGGGGDGVAGDPAAGKEVFSSVSPACGSCHTLADAGSTAEVGPNLDESLQGQDAALVEESIVNPDAQVADGFTAGVMPGDFGEKLSEDDLANLVAYLLEATGGG
jgi:mono/diheme cytochrome c family protein